MLALVEFFWEHFDPSRGWWLLTNHFWFILIESISKILEYAGITSTLFAMIFVTSPRNIRRQFIEKWVEYKKFINLKNCARLLLAIIVVLLWNVLFSPDLPTRRIVGRDYLSMKRILSKNPGDVLVYSNAHDNEAAIFAEDIFNLLEDSNWHLGKDIVEPYSSDIGGPDQEGVTILARGATISSDVKELTANPSLIDLQKAFAICHEKVTILIEDDIEPDYIVIRVGPNDLPD